METSELFCPRNSWRMACTQFWGTPSATLTLESQTGLATSAENIIVWVFTNAQKLIVHLFRLQGTPGQKRNWATLLRLQSANVQSMTWSCNTSHAQAGIPRPTHVSSWTNPPCTVVTISNDNSSTVKVLHCGNHNHPRPPNTHPSQEAKRKLREIVESNPGAGPAKLKVGVGNAPPADQIDPAFMNEDRLAYERRKILDANKPKGIKGGIGAFHALA